MIADAEEEKGASHKSTHWLMGKGNKGLAGLGQTLMIAAAATSPGDQTEGALSHPVSGQRDKPAGRI
ncbi:hypothetical protein KTH_56480 [Thermosporothrix hazakensis]|jgi:hypothetical protein|nr:hypothetical protein KTH_56480 [Thermosporothrix hazakensis]